MPNPIKYSTGSETLALKKGNFYIGTGDVGKGPTSSTGYYNGITPPTGGYTIYLNKETGGPSIYTASNDEQLISLTNSIAGTSYTTANECLVYFAGQTDKVVLNRDYEGIVTDGLVLNLDAGFTPSYPRSGTTWSDVGGSNNGTLINGPTFNSDNGGSIVFDGVDDFIQIPYDSYWDSNVFGTATNFTIECWYKPNVFRNWDTMIMKWNPSVGGWFSSTQGASIWSNINGFQAGFSSGVAGNPGGSFVEISYSTSTLKWYHLSLTGDGTMLRFYVDGVERGTGLVASRTVPVTTSNNGPTFGRRAFMNGQLSNSIFYTRALTAAEVLQNFNATKGRFGL